MTAIQPGPRRRPLRIALGSALSARQRRFLGLRARGAAPALEFVLKSSLALRFLRRTELRQHLHLHPSLQVLVRESVERSPSAEPRVVQPGVGAALPRSAPTMLLVRTVQSRLVERASPMPIPVVERVLHRFTQTVLPPPAGARSAEPVMAVRQVLQRSQPLEMTVRVVGGARRTPAAEAAPPAASPPAFGRERPGSLPQQAANGMPIERITEQVVRALDARMVAWRERMGRS
jgi:hypothetical protein